MKIKPPQFAHILAWVCVDSSISNGFVLPLLQIEEEEDMWFVQQIDEADDCISSFVKFDGKPNPNNFVETSFVARIGEPQIYAF